MATTPASLENTLEETVKISATMETGSLPSARRNLEAVFFDLDDPLVLSFMLLTQSLTKLFRPRSVEVMDKPEEVLCKPEHGTVLLTSISLMSAKA
ncbi:hypothetical protein CY35_19G052900 [Sphagnum magellanicum]|jgi:hypothetical protein|nr:hypothetical protein CY35_19G052900 [Sphagnum magellanicum]